MTLTIRPGETVALVGSSGAGKTSLVSVIPRFYEPTAGRLFIDGHDITTLTLASLRAQIALVTQDVLLFDDTIAANIAYGAMAGTPREAVERAAAAAHALEFIRALPQGFDTQVGENGVRLSGGQRQRIAIARAILKDAPILILDEATSALDSESERAVQAALDTLMQGRTTIVIAHRLSTIEHADRIVVLEHGRIVRAGLASRPPGAQRRLRPAAPDPVRNGTGGGMTLARRRQWPVHLAIAHTEASMGWGGQEIRTLTEAAGFIARGHRVVIYAAPGARILAEAPRYGVPAVALPIGEKQPRGVGALVGAFRANPVDIVNGAQLHRHVARRTGLPLAARARPSATRADPHAPRLDPRAAQPRDALAVSARHGAHRDDRRDAARAARARQRHRPGEDRFGAHGHRSGGVRAAGQGRRARARSTCPRPRRWWGSSRRCAAGRDIATCSTRSRSCVAPTSAS